MMKARVFLVLSLSCILGVCVAQPDIPEGDGDGPGGIILSSLGPEPTPIPSPGPEPEPTPGPKPEPEPTPGPDPPSEEPCPDLDDCNLVCAFGYTEDPDSGCPVCECITGPDDEEDTTDGDESTDDSTEATDDSTQDSSDSTQDSGDSADDSGDSADDSGDSADDSGDSVSDSTAGETAESRVTTQGNDDTTEVVDSTTGGDTTRDSSDTTQGGGDTTQGYGDMSGNTTQGDSDKTQDSSDTAQDSGDTTQDNDDMTSDIETNFSSSEVTVSDSTTGEATVSDSTTGETTVSDSTTGETTVSNSTTGESDSTTGEATVSDSTTGEATVSDSTTGETTVSNSTTGETTVSDSTTGEAIETSNGAEMTLTDDISEAIDITGVTHDSSDTYESINSSDTSLDSSDIPDSSDSSDSSDTLGIVIGVRCPTVRRLISEGCRLSCIVLNETTGCPTCNNTCVKEGGSEQCQSDEDCGNYSICLAVGRFGERACVDLLDEGERCDSGDDYDGVSQDEDSTGGRRDRERGLGRVNGGLARYSVGHIQSFRIPCGDGLVCARVSIDKEVCRRMNENGTCTVASGEGADVVCDENGDFEATQCEQQEGGSFLCQCVQRDGTPVANTQVDVASVDDAPDCEDIVYGRCEYVGIGGVSVSIRHGDTYLSPDNCIRCLCNAGEGIFCEPAGDCTSFARSSSCFRDGVEYANGQTFQDGCNTCGCRNGEILCTRIRCEVKEEEEEDACDRCRTLPRQPVCANGRTFHSECFATACNGINASVLLPGPCQRYDVCTDLYPCAEGEICVRRGGASCFTRDGCEPEDLRICVRPDELVCEDKEEEDDDDFVCGTNGVTYRSLCELLQDTEKEQAAYGGRCDDEECSGGPVCGTDGVTYDNVCLLKSLSANARVDYRGVCEPDGEDSPDELCIRVSRARRCAYNSSNCRRRVRPEEGCCALCGGIVFVRIDFDDLDEFVRINPQGRTVDALVAMLIKSGFISEEVIDRCLIEATLTNSGDLEIALVTRDEDNDAEFCNINSIALAEKLNSPSTTDTLPEIIQFINAARAAPVIVEEEMGPEGPSGASGLTSSLLALAMGIVMVLFI